MFKILLGFLLGCFVTFNYVMPNEKYKQLFEYTNQLVLEFVQSLEEEISKNVNSQ